jgi:hypothetical protein
MTYTEGEDEISTKVKNVVSEIAKILSEYNNHIRSWIFDLTFSVWLIKDYEIKQVDRMLEIYVDHGNLLERQDELRTKITQKIPNSYISIGNEGIIIWNPEFENKTGAGNE